MEHMFTVSENIAIFAKLREDQAPISHEMKLARLMEALEFFHGQHRVGLAVVRSEMSIDMSPFVSMAEMFRDLLKAARDHSQAEMLLEMTVKTDACASACANLSADSAQAVAMTVKSNHDALEAFVVMAKQSFEAWGLDYDTFSETKAAESCITNATQKSVIWGAQVLLGRKNLRHQEQGREGRDRIRTLYKMRVEAERCDDAVYISHS